MNALGLKSQVLLLVGLLSASKGHSQQVKCDFNCSVEKFQGTLRETRETFIPAMREHFNQILSLDDQIKSLDEQIQATQQQIDDMNQLADDIANNSALPQQPQGGGSPSGGGDGGGGGGNESGEVPKAPEAPKLGEFQTPPPPTEGDLSAFADRLNGQRSGRGLFNPTEFTSPTLPNLAGLGAKQPTASFSPADVAAGQLPQLQGNSTIGSPIASASSNLLDSAANPAAGAGGQQGMNPFGGAMGAGGGGGAAAAGGEPFGTVGNEGAPEAAGGTLRVNTMEAGTGGGGASESAGSETSEDGATASDTKALSEIVTIPGGRASSKGSASDSTGKGLGVMAYVGFTRSLCADTKRRQALGICMLPTATAAPARTQLHAKGPVARPARTPASTNATNGNASANAKPQNLLEAVSAMAPTL